MNTKTKTTKRASQREDESAVEYLRRVISNCNYENEGMLEQFPCVEAVLDFFDLWAAYDTDFWSGIIECIAEGDDPEKARAFVRKWNLGDAWLEDISNAVRIAKEPA